MPGLFDAAGWIGGALVAIAYVLVSSRRVSAESPAFQALNILGAAMVGIASLHQHAMPSAGWNLVWVLIGLQSFLGTVLRRSHPRATLTHSKAESTQPEPAARELAAA